MTDLLSLCPMYFYIGLYHIWWWVQLLPWPDLSDIFGSFCIFLILWYPRNYLEKRWLKRRFGHHKAKRPPSAADHQTAAASISSIFTNHH